jgi:hypothetical protein
LPACPVAPGLDTRARVFVRRWRAIVRALAALLLYLALHQIGRRMA